MPDAAIRYLPRDQVRTVASIGAGSVGKSWTALHLAKGYRVVATDPAPGFEAGLTQFVHDVWAGLRRLKYTTAAEPPLDLLTFARSPAEAAEHADLIQENAPEDPDLKANLISVLDEAAAPDRLIFSSTGGISATVLQSRCRHPDRVVVAHPFNPPHIIPLVEIVGGDRTSPEAVEWARAFMTDLGKKPIVLRREVTGHLANRLQGALLREAFHCLVEQVASAQDIDDAVRYGLGLRWALMGGIMTFNLAGGPGGATHTLDLAADAFESWWADLGQPHLTPDVRAKIIAGAAEIQGDRSIPSWVAWRDENLIRMIEQIDD